MARKTQGHISKGTWCTRAQKARKGRHGGYVEHEEMRSTRFNIISIENYGKIMDGAKKKSTTSLQP